MGAESQKYTTLLEIGGLALAPVIVHCIGLIAVSSLPSPTRTRAGLTASAN